MEAACVSLALLLGWSAIGYGPSAILAGHRPPVVRILLAPAVGIALVTLPTFWINRLGLPVQSFAAILAGALLAVSIAATLWAQKTKAALRRSDLAAAAVLLVLLIGAIALVGWPGLIHGLNWLGYANDDMANYALSAARLRAHGYFEMPSLKAVVEGSDISQFYWILTLDSRYGGDLVLAMAASLLQQSEAMLFMPMMVALHAAVIAAAAALVTTEQPRLEVAVAALVIGAINPLIGFSTYSELLAQVGGLALTAATLALLVDPWRSDAKSMARTATIVGITLFASFIWYYEVLILVLPAIGLYFLLHWRQTLAAWKSLTLSAVAVLAAIALLSGSYLKVAYGTIQIQLENGSTIYPSDSTVFPYFLVKAGLSSFWGLSSIVDLNLGWSSWNVLLAVVLFALALAALARTLWQGRMSACIVATFSLVAAGLLWRRADFGVFKSVLYLQPFLAALLAAELARLIGRPNIDIAAPTSSWLARYRGLMPFAPIRSVAIVICAIVAMTAIIQLRTLFQYGQIAADRPGTSYFIQLPGGTRLGLLRILDELPRPHAGGHFVLDSDNSVLTKLITLFAIGTPVRMVSFNPFKTAGFLNSFERNFPGQLANAKLSPGVSVPFVWPTSGEQDVLQLQSQATSDPRPGDLLIATAADSSVLNRFHLGYPHTAPVVLRGIETVSNHLAFLPTVLKGRHYFDYDIPADKFSEYRRQIALWPNEPDYFFKGRTMVGAGRYIMLRTINPSLNPRLMLELTASLKADGDNRLPPVQVIGQSAAPLGAIGRGSARLYSRRLAPWRLGDASVVGIDMGVDGRRFTDPDGNLTLDIRRLTSFVRDISLVADNAYETLEPPSEVRSFPQGLADKALEYSGLYEDGWMGEAAFLRLAGPKQHAQFRISGQARGDAKAAAVSELVVRVDGVEKARQRLAPGQFTIAFDLAPSDGPIRVELQANAAVALSPADRRPASVQLSSVGWRPDTDSYPSAFKPASDRSDVAAAVGFWADGWAATRAQLTLADGAAGQLAIRGMAPKLEQPFTTKLVVTVDGKPIGTLEVEPGDVVADLPLAGSDRPRRITLEFEEGQDLPPPDARHVGMLVHEIAVK